MNKVTALSIALNMAIDWEQRIDFNGLLEERSLGEERGIVLLTASSKAVAVWCSPPSPLNLFTSSVLLPTPRLFKSQFARNNTGTL